MLAREGAVGGAGGSGAGRGSGQLVRSVGKWAAGLKEKSVENSIHVAYIHLISSAKNFIYIENQFFISGHSEINNKVAEAIVHRIMRAAQ
jgi:phospholipase D1/2